MKEIIKRALPWKIDIVLAEQGTRFGQRAQFSSGNGLRVGWR
jgi:hypothetical protein